MQDWRALAADGGGQPVNTWERESAGLKGSSRRRGWTARKYVGERERESEGLKGSSRRRGWTARKYVGERERECRIEGL